MYHRNSLTLLILNLTIESEIPIRITCIFTKMIPESIGNRSISITRQMSCSRWLNYLDYLLIFLFAIPRSG